MKRFLYDQRKSLEMEKTRTTRTRVRIAETLGARVCNLQDSLSKLLDLSILPVDPRLHKYSQFGSKKTNMRRTVEHGDDTGNCREENESWTTQRKVCDWFKVTTR